MRSPASDIRLRDVSEEDFPIFFEHQCDPEANQMAAFPPRDRNAFMAHWGKISRDENNIIKTILFDGQVAGYLGSWKKDGKQVVGYWIGRKHWGRGVATQGLSAFVRVVEARPLYAYVAKHNIGSIRVLEKCGFMICREETNALGPPEDGVEELVFKLSPDEEAEAH